MVCNPDTTCSSQWLNQSESSSSMLLPAKQKILFLLSTISFLLVGGVMSDKKAGCCFVRLISLRFDTGSLPDYSASWDPELVVYFDDKLGHSFLHSDCILSGAFCKAWFRIPKRHKRSSHSYSSAVHLCSSSH